MLSCWLDDIPLTYIELSQTFHLSCLSCRQLWAAATYHRAARLGPSWQLQKQTKASVSPEARHCVCVGCSGSNISLLSSRMLPGLGGEKRALLFWSGQQSAYLKCVCERRRASAFCGFLEALICLIKARRFWCSLQLTPKFALFIIQVLTAMSSLTFIISIVPLSAECTVFGGSVCAILSFPIECVTVDSVHWQKSTSVHDSPSLF